jgi:hypothetical protein
MMASELVEAAWRFLKEHRAVDVPAGPLMLARFAQDEIAKKLEDAAEHWGLRYIDVATWLRAEAARMRDGHA